jgi:16S rRNA (cytosine1402-N4)-methyltransferase
MVRDFFHRPVLLQEVMHYLIQREGGTYLDATLGAGGHAEAILERDPRARVVGVETDSNALIIAQHRLERFGDRFQTIHSNFAHMANFFKDRDIKWLDGILADLGVSSMQLDTPERGFSFMQDGPLDMRMDTELELRAEDVVNHFSEEDLADLIYQLGEERFSRRIARAIVAHRPLTSTIQLAAIVADCFPRAVRQRIHPATRTFQALRIYVNDELNVLKRFLDDMPSWLAPGGRAVVISFHSLEDRLVKQAFRQWEKESLARILTKHVVTASDDERQSNPRSRSAKLRAAEKHSESEEADSEK